MHGGKREIAVGASGVTLDTAHESSSNFCHWGVGGGLTVVSCVHMPFLSHSYDLSL